MNDGVAVTFNAAIGVSTLSMNGTAGNLVLQNANLNIINSITGGGAGKYIQTNGTSSVTISGNASSKFFPVGTNLSYTPLTIANGNVSTHSFNVRLSNVFANAPNNNSVVNREWNILGNPGGAIADLTFQWNASDEDPAFNRNVSYVGHHNGIAWEKVSSAAPPTGSNPYTKTATNVSSFSPFGVGSNGALPVTWLYFKASQCDNKACLQWSTDNELNTSTYFIERSRNGRDFENIGILPATNRSGTQVYNYQDGTIADEMYYYRIKQVDLDQRFTYSKIVKFDGSKIQQVFISPNPSKGLLFIDGAEKFSLIQVIDMNGKTVKQLPVKHHDNRYDISNLPGGIYMVKLISASETKVVKVLKE